MSTRRPLPVWRSMLYVPATSERFIERAADRGADVVKIDLEDSVAPSEKARARTLVRDAAKVVGAKGADVLVRINRPWRMTVPDLEASIWPEVGGICLPKVESADHVGFVSEVIDELEAERGIAVGTTRLLPLIETARGLANVRAIALSSPRLAGISLGQEDFAAAMGMAETDPDALAGYTQQVQVAAREAGILPLGYPGSIAVFQDIERFRSFVLRARRMGFEGGSAIHPAQVPVLNEAFAPTAEEIARAEGLVAAYDAALAAGQGAVTYEGKMIDVPIVERGRRILALRDRIAARG
jgi:citrate lyase subunit beta / citryl-CoA lyase